jgi:epothilone synthetase B
VTGLGTDNERVVELLSHALELGIEVLESGGNLTLTGSRLPPDFVENITSAKPAIIRWLAEARTASTIVPDRAGWHETFPTTAIQRAYLIGRGDDFELGGVATHAYHEIECVGLDVGKLSAALDVVVRRHGVLRTTFEGLDTQRSLSSVPAYQIRVENLCGRGDAEREIALKKTRAQMSHQVMDPYSWPLFDIRVSKVDMDTSVLHISIDALALDANSMYRFFQEWHEVYASGGQSSRPQLDITFRDYVLADLKRSQTPGYLKAKAYWEARVLAFPGPPDVPVATSPKGLSAATYVRRTATIDEARWSCVRESARRLGVTPNVLLLWAYSEVLGVWSTTQSFAINVTLFNRGSYHPDVGELLGNFTSVIPLEVSGCKLDPLERLRSIHRQLLSDIEHADYGGLEFLKLLARRRGGGTAALLPFVFTSTLGFAGDTPDAAVLEGFGRERFALSQTPQVWLDQIITELHGRLVVHFDSPKGLFDEHLLDDLVEAYTQLLHRVAAGNCPSNELLELIPPRHLEARSLACAPDREIPRARLEALIQEMTLARPEAAAIQSVSGSMTYAMLWDEAKRLASRLHSLGPNTGGRVGVLLRRGPRQIAAIIGCLQAGVSYVPLDPDTPASRLRSAVEVAELSLVVSETALHPVATTLQNVHSLLLDEIGEELASVTPMAVNPSAEAYTIFTSGSTGRPKGVMVSHHSVINTVQYIADRFEVGPQDALIALSGTHFDLSVFDIFGALTRGAKLVVLDHAARNDPAHWLELMIAGEVTIWNSVPALAEMLASHLEARQERLPNSMRLFILSGDFIPVDLPTRLRKLSSGHLEVVSAGGPTETTVWNVMHIIGEVDPRWKSIPYGVPTSNNRSLVLNSRLQHCPNGVLGELYAAGEGLALGYLNNPEANTSSFVRDPRTGERLYRTGDLCRFDAAGVLEIAGRADFQIKRNGYRIEPGEIEHVLRSHPQVVEAVVTPTESKTLVAHVVRRGSDNFEKSADRHAFRSQEHWRRSESGQPGVSLMAFDDHILMDVMRTRQSLRHYKESSLDAGAIGQLLSLLARKNVGQNGVEKLAYPSAGGLYPVQTFVFVREGVRSAIPGGAYYLDSREHRLISLGNGDFPEASAFGEPNEAVAAVASFSLLFVAELDAIEPVYGDNALNMSTLEAGYMGQLLMGFATKVGIGLCPVGALEPLGAACELPLQLGPRRVLVHAMLGGPIDDSWRTTWSVEGADTPTLDAEMLRQWTNERLPHYMVPDTFLFWGVLPLSANGKVDRGSLREESGRQLSERTGKPVNTPTEREIAAIWRRLLRMETICATDNFFRLGGDSLLAIMLGNEIRQRMSVTVPVPQMLTNPTVEQLARYIDTIRATKDITAELSDGYDEEHI